MQHDLVAPRVFNINGTSAEAIRADAHHCAQAARHLQQFMRTNLMPHGRDYQTVESDTMSLSQEAREEFGQVLAKLGEVEEYCSAVLRNASDPSIAIGRYKYRKAAAKEASASEN